MAAGSLEIDVASHFLLYLNFILNCIILYKIPLHLMERVRVRQDEGEISLPWWEGDL